VWNSVESAAPSHLENASNYLECFESYVGYFRSVEIDRERSYSAAVSSSVGFVEETSLFLSTQTFAPNRTYALEDNIPRVEFLGAPTSTKAITVTVTKTKVNADFLPTQQPPACSLGPVACLKLWASRFDELRSGTSNFSYLEKACPIPDYCDYRDQGDVLLINFGSKPDPASEHNASINYRAFILTTTAITFIGSKIHFLGTPGSSPVTTPHFLTPSVLYGSFTFTTPTVYIALPGFTLKDTATGIDNSSRVSTRTPGIIPVLEQDMFSIRPYIGSSRRKPGYANSIAFNSYNPIMFRNEKIQYEVEHYDFASEIPASVYYDGRNEDCWGRQSHCGVITQEDHRPTLAIPGHLRSSLDFELKPSTNSTPCPYVLLPDPPITLSPIGKDDVFMPDEIMGPWPTPSTSSDPSLLEHVSPGHRPVVESVLPTNSPLPKGPFLVDGSDTSPSDRGGAYRRPGESGPYHEDSFPRHGDLRPGASPGINSCDELQAGSRGVGRATPRNHCSSPKGWSSSPGAAGGRDSARGDNNGAVFTGNSGFLLPAYWRTLWMSAVGAFGAGLLYN
jgi:hypothetical protein